MPSASPPRPAAVPPWTVSFLRDRCSELQRALVRPAAVGAGVPDEEDALINWTTVLGGLPPDHPARVPFERLHLLHARVSGRLDRGGLRDIAPDVEVVVAAMLIDRLQHLTDIVVDLIG